MRRHDVIIVGAGQAGLGLSHSLTRRGVDHLILEKGDVARAWAEDRWDSFCLVTPNWTITLPGAEYQGDDPDGFIPRGDFVDHLRQWAKRFGAPVQTGVEVLGLAPDAGGFRLETSRGPFLARQVVLATATHQRPRLPDAAEGLSGVAQLHAVDYRNAGALPPGGVLVVGSGQSGCQIAEELTAAGRETYLAVGRTGRLPRRYRGRDCIAWQDDMGWLDRTPDMLDDPARRFRGDPHLTGAGGGRTLSLHMLRRQGVTLLGRIAGAAGSRLAFHDDLAEGLAAADAFAADFRRAVDEHIARAAISAPAPTDAEMAGEPDGAPPPAAPDALDVADRSVGAVIWATGFRFDFAWIGARALDRFGYPASTDGASAVPGLYFMGLNWLPKRKSGIIYGVAEDAERLATRIVADRASAVI